MNERTPDNAGSLPPSEGELELLFGALANELVTNKHANITEVSDTAGVVANAELPSPTKYTIELSAEVLQPVFGDATRTLQKGQLSYKTKHFLEDDPRAQAYHVVEVEFSLRDADGRTIFAQYSISESGDGTYEGALYSVSDDDFEEDHWAALPAEAPNQLRDILRYVGSQA